MREFFLAHVAFSVVTMTLLAALWGGQSAMWKLTLNGIKWGVGIVGLLFLLSSQVWLFWAGQVLPAEIPHRHCSSSPHITPRPSSAFSPVHWQ